MSNTSGLTPYGERVVVILDPIDEKMGIIAKTKEQIDKEYQAQTFATVVAVGPNVQEPDITVDRRVVIGKFTGLLQEGKDGRRYRIVNEDNILAGAE